jgi:hypothetical protein
VAAEVPSGANKGAWTGLFLDLKDTGLNQDTCKGATAVITYTVNS